MINYLLIYAGWLIGLFIIGHLSIWLFRISLTNNLFASIFRNIFLGYSIVIILFSIYHTHFSTINLVFIFILLFLYIEDRKKKKEVKEIIKINLSLNHILIVLIGAISVFLYNWNFIYFPESYLQFIYSWGDYILYAKISDSIASLGHENGFTVLNTLDSYYHNPEPYHFFDLWGAAVVNHIFKINNYLSLMLLIYPTFYFLCLIGMLSLIRNVNYLHLIIVVLLLFTGGIFIRFSDSVPFFNNLANISFNLLTPGPYKLSYFYVFLLAAYLAFRYNIVQGFLMLAALPVANIITAPPVFPSIMVLLIMLFNTNQSKRELNNILFYVTVIMLSIIIFYLINQRESSGLAGAEITSPINLLTNALSAEGLITRRNILIASIMGILLLYAPFLFVIGLNRNKFSINNTPIIMVMVVVLMSILMWALLYKELNSSQIFYDISIPLINLVILIVILQILINFRKKLKYFITLFILFIIIFYNINKNFRIGSERKMQKHSNEYLKMVNENLPENSLVATIKSPVNMMEMHSKYNTAFPLGDYLFLFNKNIYSVNIGDLSTPIDSSSSMNLQRSNKAIRDGIFYRFSQSKENMNLSNDQLMMKFINKFQIKFLLLDADIELPTIISENTKKIITDQKSKERFIIL